MTYFDINKRPYSPYKQIGRLRKDQFAPNKQTDKQTTGGTYARYCHWL